MKVRFLISLFFFLSMVRNGHAQNLVPNPSFELNTACPTGSSQIALAIPWQGVTTNSTDYFHVCGSGSVTVPRSGPSYQPSRIGGAYTGLWVINSYGYNYREYIQVKLNAPLLTDSCYLVEFFCSPNGGCKWAIKNIGACISSTAINDTGPWGLVLQYVPQIESPVIVSDTAGWTRVSGYYQALGGEEYITIGSFVTDSLTDTLNIGGSYDGAYYYIEDVRVEKVVACDTATTITEAAWENIFHIYPNPNNGNMIVSYELKTAERAELIIFDITGHQVGDYSLDPAAGSLTLSNQHWSPGIYFCQLQLNSRTVLNDKLVITP